MFNEETATLVSVNQELKVQLRTLEREAMEQHDRQRCLEYELAHLSEQLQQADNDRNNIDEMRLIHQALQDRIASLESQLDLAYSINAEMACRSILAADANSPLTSVPSLKDTIGTIATRLDATFGHPAPVAPKTITHLYDFFHLTAMAIKMNISRDSDSVDDVLINVSIPDMFIEMSEVKPPVEFDQFSNWINTRLRATTNSPPSTRIK